MNQVEEPRSTAARVKAAFATIPVSDDAVRDAVCAYADDMKRLGAPIERIIIEVKRLAMVQDGALARALRARDHQAHRDADGLLERAVTWCIEQYYHPPKA